MKTHIFSSLVLVYALLCSACKKYQDDEYLITLKDTSQRLKGEWEITSYEVDRIDRLDSLKSRWGECWGKLRFTIERHGYNNLYLKSEVCVFRGSYQFTGGNKNFIQFHLLENGYIDSSSATPIPVNNRDGIIPFAFLDYNSWEILQADNKNFRFRCNYMLTDQIISGRKL